MKNRFYFLASMSVVVLMLAMSIMAQRTTGDIEGTITDNNGAIVPGATVKVVGRDVGFTRSVVSDGSGLYRLTQIPVGNYTVTVAETKGFKSATADANIGINNLTTLDFKLSTAVSAVVDVNPTDTNIIDASETKAQTNFSARQIDELPKGTNFTSLLKNSVSVRPEPLSGQLSINGSTGPENSFLIDGQETQNYLNGVININNDIPYQAVSEIQVKTSGFEAEFGGATGGVVSAVTKSGSNTFHGEFGMNLAPQVLQAGPHPVSALTNSTSTSSSPSIATTGQYLEYFPQARDGGIAETPTFLMSGPIIKDKVWFFAIHNPRIFDITRTTHYVQGFGANRLPRVLSPAIIAAGGTTDQTVTEHTVYNYTSARIDAAPFSTLRLSSSFTWNPIVDNSPLLGGSYVNGSPGTATLNGKFYQGAGLAALQGGRQNSSNFRVEGIWTPTSSVVVDLRYTRGFQNQKLGSYGISADPLLICSSIQDIPAGLTAIQLAALAGCSQGFSNIATNVATTKNVSLRQTYDANATYSFNGLGRHEIKGGYQYSSIFNDINSGNIVPTGGQGRTYLYYGTNTGGIDCRTTYVQWSIQCPTVGFIWPLPPLAPGATVIGSGVNYQYAASGHATDTADTLFIQDKWQPTPRLTLNLGLRLEDENIPAFNATHISLKWGWGAKIAPRIGVSYALTSDGKTKIAGFYGLFFDRLKFDLPQGSFGGQFYHVSYFYITSDHPQYTYYTVRNLMGSYTFPIGGTCPITVTNENGYLCDQDYRIASNVPGADVYTNGAVDPNIKPYEQEEMSFEFQREIMRSSVLTARFLRRNLLHVIEDAGIPTAAGEAYVIGNPGDGLAKQIVTSLGYKQVAVPQRVYNALQVEYDTRYFRNLSLNLNYTLSRLYGNYSGLANPDELTTAGGPRLDPNVSREFDEPWVGFAAGGGKDNGILPLDRTHVFKASGTYTFDWMRSKSNSTDLSFFTTAESGTPRTTFVNIMGIPIVETKRGDLGRTPMFSQTDLSIGHKYRFGSDNRFAIGVDFNVLNVFNQDTPLAFDQNLTSAYWNLAVTSIDPLGSKVTATNTLTSTGVLAQYAAQAATICTSNPLICGVGVATNLRFQHPFTWQDPRAIRFGFRFMF